MSLALATLVYEWRRYMAAVIAIALAGLFLLAQIGLFGGIVHSVLATIERARADIYILDPTTEDTVRSWSTLPRRITPRIFMNPEVIDVAGAARGGGLWSNLPTPAERQVQVFVVAYGVDLEPHAVSLPTDYPEFVRVALQEPMAVAVDQSVLKRLGVKLGDQAVLNGRTVTLRAILHNYQDPQRTDVVMSRATLTALGLLPDDSNTGPLMVRIKDPSRAAQVRDQLNAAAHGDYRAWTREDLSVANEMAVLKLQVVGALLTFTVFVGVLLGIGITSQTMRGAILSNIKEFASLRALGVSMGSLRLIVIELSAWVGIAGLIATGLVTYLTSLAAKAMGLPMVFFPGSVVWVCAILMAIAIGSGALAMGVLNRSQPADLLR